MSISPLQEDCLRELARGPLLSFPENRWARYKNGKPFEPPTVRGLIRAGYARVGDTTVRLTPAGLDACRLRGWLPALAKVGRGDSHLAAE